MARKLEKRLIQLGANKVLDIGLGDDQHEASYFQEFVIWLEKLKTFLKSNFKTELS